jgi:Flp pilus assembly protein TadG
MTTGANATVSAGDVSGCTGACGGRTSAPARGHRRGATALEFAVVAPVLFTIVLGIIELGRAIMVIHTLTNAARVGARIGAIEGTSTSTITGAVTANLAANGISSDTVTVQVNDGSSDASTAQAGDEITVKVTVPTTSVSWLPGVKYLSGTLSGQYTLRRE